MKNTLLKITFFGLSALYLAGCASNPDSGSAAGRSTRAMAVPTLSVATDCGACEVRSTIPALIVKGYQQAAASDGASISAGDAANLVVKEYTARDSVARFMVGALAGKDEIKAVVTYQGSQFSVEDYYRNAWLGIETLAEKIGELTYSQLKQAQK